MKSKYYEYIIIYLSIAIACAAIGLIVRVTVVSQGVDEFSANAIFWLITGIGILAYCVLTVVIQGLLDKTTQLIFSKRKKPKQDGNIVKTLSLEEIRSEKQKQNDQQKEEKLNTAIQYTQKMFAPYISDNDMNMLCKYIAAYSQGTSIKDTTIHPVKVNELTTTDICHFGWNIWNHFKPIGDQWEISRFLKTVFQEKLKEVELETVKKKLKIFENKCIIQIKESLIE